MVGAPGSGAAVRPPRISDAAAAIRLERDFDEHERELLRDAVALLERIADG